ncbi:dockerin type I domain-containing protein [uncultured Ruminococcus sp.]|uniref:dockerin type I domain-containing protein n=1 Tax=uncultured Ruminococcus sp. TaxID=165186 RepID=UPI0025FAE492|nr:dockerin type I domain-containing protein [uncultured Ruminococcus sp.]
MKERIKKLTSILLAAIMVSTLFTVSLTANAADADKVRVTVKNEVYSTADGAVWDGTLLDEWVSIDESSTMMSVLVSVLDSKGYTQTGAESDYVTEINGLKAGDAGYMSGWMGTINDWFADEGYGAFSVTNGTLESGDELCFVYSNAWGADVGSLWDSNDTSLASLSLDKGTLSPEFSSSVKEYTLTLENETGVVVTPTAVNKNYQVRTYKNEYTPTVDGSEFKRSSAIDVKDGDTIYVAVGDPAWRSMNSSESANVYTINVKVNDKVAEKLESTGEYLLSQGVPGVGSVGGEWRALGLARAGKITSELSDGYYENLVSYIEENGSAKLDARKSTENSRVIIALSAIGKDATDVAGYNLLEPLADYDFVTWQGLNGPVFALIALDTYNYEIPNSGDGVTQTTRENLINYILESQLENGGWTFFGSTADPDMTGMAIQALAPYYSKNADVKNAVDKALDVLSASQQDNGGFASWGTVNVESCAQVLTALASLGIDADTDERFIKNGNTLVDAIMEFSVENGFAHIKDSAYNQMATEQAYYALVSYNRVKNGKTSLYDMSDVKELKYDVNGDGVVNVQDCTLIQKYSADLAELTDEQLKKADCNNDGIVNVIDATTLQKIIAV